MTELLQVQDLKVCFGKKTKKTIVLDGIDLTVKAGEIHGLVGESGSGKTISALSILRLLPQNAEIIDGRVRWKGVDLLTQSAKEMLRFRGKEISMIFQNPQAALNPLYSIEQQMIDLIRLHHGMPKARAREEALHWLDEVNFPEPRKRIRSYSHELSGGMCQRVLIAMALACKPKLLIADEPTAALDVTIQAQILDLLLEIKDKFNMAILLISHDLGVVARTCDQVTVMYLGKIIESASVDELFSQPCHPYTQALLKAVPLPDPTLKGRLKTIRGDVPDHRGTDAGCRFQDRCPRVMDRCRREEPPFVQCGNTGSRATCWLMKKVIPSDHEQTVN